MPFFSKWLLSFFKRSSSTTSVEQNVDPTKWKEHFFGLHQQRWQRLSGSIFWITGAGTGYGRSIACALAATGSVVYLSGRREEKLYESISECRRLFAINTDNCHVLPTDVTVPSAIEKSCQIIDKQNSKLTGIIHCAALPSLPTSPFPLRDGLSEKWDDLMMTNVKAPWLVTKTAFPLMLKNNTARVLFFSSGAGWADTVGFGIYNISKAALNSLGRSIAREFEKAYPEMDIQINTMDPGEAKTEMNRGTDISRYQVVSMTLKLLSHPPGGPNGYFFHRDGRHLTFCNTAPFPIPIT